MYTTSGPYQKWRLNTKSILSPTFGQSARTATRSSFLGVLLKAFSRSRGYFRATATPENEKPVVV